MKKSFCSALIIGAIATYAVPVQAAEETLKFRLVVHHVSSGTMNNPNDGGPGLTATQSVGVAVLEDGRLAYKEFVWIGFEGEPAVPSHGLSSYVFENGDALHVQFTSGPEEGGYFVNYDVLSGSGTYAGATGTGRLAAKATKWDDATLFEGAINVTTP